jgi:hypothetical protein
MCDYSLFAIPNRLAAEKEDLVAHRFPTGSMGLASPHDLQRQNPAATCAKRGFWASFRNLLNPPVSRPVPAVCIPPGARLRLEDIPARIQQDLRVGTAEEVTFVQMSAAVNTYRDAVRFDNGRELPLQALREGMRVKVLSLEMAEPLTEEIIRERQEQEFLIRVR